MKKRNWKEVVVYDDSSEDLSSLPYSHTLFLVINSLLEDGRQPIMLIGGLRAFQVRDHWWHVGPDHECACVAFWREAVFNMHIWPLSPTTLACSHNCPFYDASNEIYQMICDQGGLHAMAQKNSIGITPSKYLAANPYAEVDEKKLVKRFVLEKMSEIV